MNDDATFLETISDVVKNDLDGLITARKNYGESWCKRGGVGAFMMLARKWDRLENYLSITMKSAGKEYDILEAIFQDGRPEGIIDDIRDLRRYLILIEAKAQEQGDIAQLKKNLLESIQSAANSFAPMRDDTPPASVLHDDNGMGADGILRTHQLVQTPPPSDRLKGSGDFETAFQRLVSDVGTFAATMMADGCNREVTLEKLQMRLSTCSALAAVLGDLVAYKLRHQA